MMQVDRHVPCRRVEHHVAIETIQILNHPPNAIDLSISLLRTGTEQA